MRRRMGSMRRRSRRRREEEEEEERERERERVLRKLPERREYW